MALDLSLYLVTDSTPAILGSRDLGQVVDAALRGGVTVVQYRDKHSSRDVFVATARELHEITKRHGVPLLINDRVDVAVEVGCEGVHIGQDDMDLHEARRLLGPEKTVGVTVSSTQEALAACAAGADYLGIGPVFATSTKKDTKAVLEPVGVADILDAVRKARYTTPAVCIGGINRTTLGQVLFRSQRKLLDVDGIAVVSCIMAAPDPASEAHHLADRVLRAKFPRILNALVHKKPLSHNMTNLVVQNLAANVALAVGASPIMSTDYREAAELAALGGALVVNMGTASPENLNAYCRAIKAYNEARRPIVFDPVGAGATSLRRETCQTILQAGHFTVIKGNVAEMQTVNGSSVQQRGVDSSSTLDEAAMARLARSVAIRHKCVAVVTGPTDIISDGKRTVGVHNGHPLLAAVTGTGCALGTVISAMVAAYDADALVATVAGTAIFGLAAEDAACRPVVRGPGSFVPVFLDVLYRLCHPDPELFFWNVNVSFMPKVSFMD